VGSSHFASVWKQGGEYFMGKSTESINFLKWSLFCELGSLGFEYFEHFCSKENCCLNIAFILQEKMLLFLFFKGKVGL
jgi:hypothetical protein